MRTYKLLMLLEKMERVTGVEPATNGLGSRCATTALHPLFLRKLHTYVGRVKRGIGWCAHCCARESARYGLKVAGADDMIPVKH